MDGIEKDLSGIRPSDMVGLAQKTVDIANQGYGVVDTLGSCIEPLGNALQAIVKIMDSIADVGVVRVLFARIASLIISFSRLIRS